MFHHHFFHSTGPERPQRGCRPPWTHPFHQADDFAGPQRRGMFRSRHGGFGDGPFGRGERGSGPFGRGGRERLFDGGDLRLLLLQLLAEKPSYGYELIKTLETRLSGGYAPSPGVVYPTLTMLEEEGLTSAAVEGGKKVFSVTEAGQGVLAENAERLADIQSRLQRVGQIFERGRSPEIMKAFMSLRAAVKGRVSRGRLSKEQIAKLAAVIEAAAKSIDEL